MTDDEFLEKVCDLADKWSKPYLVAFGGYLLSTLIIAWNVTDWVVANARDNLGALVAFGIGGILTGAVVASLFWRHVLKKSVDAKEGAVKKRVSDEFSNTKGLERVNDLDSLIESTHDLAVLQEQLAAKDAEIKQLDKTFDERVSTEVERQVVEFIKGFSKQARLTKDPDSVIRDRIDARELDGRSTRILNLVLKTGLKERRWLRDALLNGMVVVNDDDLSLFDMGYYFQDLVNEDGDCSDAIGKPAKRYTLKPDVADVLSANKEVFLIVERDEVACREIALDNNSRYKRGMMRKDGHAE